LARIISAAAHPYFHLIRFFCTLAIPPRLISRNFDRYTLLFFGRSTFVTRWKLPTIQASN
jgi:hypothetical protein